jgi:hypothetical protein
MDAFKAAHPTVAPPERLIRATKVSADNLAAMRTSMKDRFKDNALDATDALNLTNTWENGSTYHFRVPTIQKSFNGFSKAIPAWQWSHGAAKSDSYRTSSRSDDGPEEYQIVESALQNGKTFSLHYREIIGGIQTAERDIPKLDKLVRQYVDVVLNNGQGDPDQLRTQIMTTAKGIYNANYPKGFDVEPFSGWEIFGLTLLGGLIGGGIGFGVDRGVDTLYRRRQEKRRQMN